MTEQPPSNPYFPNQPQGPGGIPWGPPPDHPQATTVLILGALGFMLCQVIAPVAWIMGGRVRREIDASGGAVGGRQMATFGWVLGIVGTCLLALSVIFLLGYLVVVALVVASDA